ncbi:MAG: 3-oxoacyl-[acyl-carrier-protein] reductase [Lachnospirales bacterium]
MLDQKVALVTGASRGIGRSIALRLARQGFFVVVNYRGAQTRAQGVLDEIENAGGQGRIYPCDVASETDVKTMIETIVKQYGRLDVVVNNAGVTKDNLILRMKAEDLDLVLDTNLKGTFYCMKYAAKQMLRQRSGRIINISSIVGIHGNAGQVNYSASKAGIIGMTKSLAKELGSRGITVNAVAPGFIETEMTEDLPEEIKKKMQESIPLGHFGQSEDIAAAVSFLASEGAAYITGQVLGVDGGMGA